MWFLSPYPLPGLEPDAAMASEVSDVDSSMVTAGGTVAANFPHRFRNSRPSSSLDDT